MREVELPAIRELVAAVGRHELAGDPLELTGRARLRGHRFEVPVDPDVGRRPDLQMQVGATALEQVMQELGQVGHCSSSKAVT